MILIAKELKKELKSNFPFAETTNIIVNDYDNTLFSDINQEVNILSREVFQNV